MINVNINKNLYILVILCQILCSHCSNLNMNLNKSSKSVKNYTLADRNTLLMRGHSTSFTDGYMDGCASGQYAAGDLNSSYTKNQELLKLNKDYLLGWEQGNSFCYQHMSNLIKNSNSNDPDWYHSQAAIEQEKQRMWSEMKK